MCSWQSQEHEPEAQVDLVVNRADGIVNLCEMKWSLGEFTITKSYDRQLRNKLSTFADETSTRKTLHLTMVTPHGVRHNAYWGTIQSEVKADDLFGLRARTQARRPHLSFCTLTSQLAK